MSPQNIKIIIFLLLLADYGAASIDEKGLVCPITLAQIKDPLLGSCGHSFEKVGLLTWLKTNDSCPVCRSSMPLLDLDSKISEELAGGETWENRFEHMTDVIKAAYPTESHNRDLFLQTLIKEISLQNRFKLLQLLLLEKEPNPFVERVHSGFLNSVKNGFLKSAQINYKYMKDYADNHPEFSEELEDQVKVANNLVFKYGSSFKDQNASDFEDWLYTLEFIPTLE